MTDSDDMRVILEAPVRTLSVVAARLEDEGIEYSLQRPPGSGGG